ncbi:MAG: VacJ family lipoprotein, partial [Proteobacteria bacterium]|nr:VacJ family lipoprotein [Pseudomonadota bacterium]
SFLGVPAARQNSVSAYGNLPRVGSGFVDAPPPRFAATQRVVTGTDQSESPEPVNPPTARGPEPISDPLESVNRAIFAFNDVIDTFTLRPLAALYGYVTPEVARVAVRRAVRNLNSPVVIANDLLQLDPVGAGVTTGRFLINSTAGVLGLFDVAKLIGLEEHHSDFGQTLHDYGLGSGPYVVLPILGPSTARDATGRIVDIFFDPLTYILEGDTAIGVAAGRGLIRREEVLDPLEKMRVTSVDYYAALRSAYYQDRARQLGITGSGASSVDSLFDAAE